MENLKLKKLNYLGSHIFESYKINIKNKSYIIDKKIDLLKANNKYDSMLDIYNMDRENKRTLCNRLNIKHDDLEVFLDVLRNM